MYSFQYPWIYQRFQMLAHFFNISSPKFFTFRFLAGEEGDLFKVVKEIVSFEKTKHSSLF